MCFYGLDSVTPRINFSRTVLFTHTDKLGHCGDLNGQFSLSGTSAGEIAYGATWIHT